MKKLLFVFSMLIMGLTSNSLHAQWVPLGGSLGGDIQNFVVFNSNIYAGGTAYLYRSTNNGNNWTGHMTNPAYAWNIASSGSNIYCGVWTDAGMTAGVYKSTNNGLNWSLVGLGNKFIFDLTGTDQELVAIALEQGSFRIFRSTDNGTNWTNITGTLSLAAFQVAISGNRIYAGGQGLHVTTNYGVNWSQLFMTDNVASISVSDSLVFIGTSAQGVYRSSNYGQTWERTLNLNKNIRSVYQYGAYVFAGADTGFYVSTNSGLTFVDRTQGLGNASIASIIIHNNYVFVSNANYLSSNVSAWRRPLSEITSVERLSLDMPPHFSLEQNYPNPFNPSTVIKWQSPVAGWQTLKVYDVLGNEVATLVDEYRAAGSYEVEFKSTVGSSNSKGVPSGLASGVYFYRLTAGSFTETKKLILMK